MHSRGLCSLRNGEHVLRCCITMSTRERLMGLGSSLDGQQQGGGDPGGRSN